MIWPLYAREELRAEISAMMTGDRVGVGHDPQRAAAYVENWVKVLGLSAAVLSPQTKKGGVPTLQLLDIHGNSWIST